MNNKGFGLSELLVFIGIFLFILVFVSIYGRAKLGNESFYNQPDVDINSVETVGEDYSSLENKLLKAARKYNINKDSNQVITLSNLKKANLIDDLIGPDNIKCDGYVMYDFIYDDYTPYINCGEKYTTK